MGDKIMDGVYDGKEVWYGGNATSILSALYSHAERLDRINSKSEKIIIPGLTIPESAMRIRDAFVALKPVSFVIGDLIIDTIGTSVNVMVPNLSDSRYLDVEFTGIARCVRGIHTVIDNDQWKKRVRIYHYLKNGGLAMTPKEVDPESEEFEHWISCESIMISDGYSSGLKEFITADGYVGATVPYDRPLHDAPDHLWTMIREGRRFAIDYGPADSRPQLSPLTQENVMETINRMFNSRWFRS